MGILGTEKHKTSVSMNDNHQSLSPEQIDRITQMLGLIGDLPEGFPEAFREWAINEGQSYKCPDLFMRWSLEIRPYTVTELAKLLKGICGRTKIYEILKTLPIPEDERKTCSGKLTPEVVRMILERVQEARINESLTEKLDRILKP